MNQKEMSKQYKYLHGKEIVVFIGRIPCNYKHIEEELSLIEKENVFGKYKKITITIRKTFFNGKYLTIYPKNFEHHSTLIEFKIHKDDISKIVFK